MHTWTVTSGDIRMYGEADTCGHAWNAAHAAAADIVAGGTLDGLILEVDGDQSTITPADSGDPAADRVAALAVIEAGRADVLAAHLTAQDQR